MKTLRTLIAFLIAVSGNALAQGTIDFHNPNTFPLKVLDLRDGSLTTLGAPDSPFGPASVRVGLFVGNVGSTFAQMTMVGMTTNSSSTLPLFVGTFNGGNPFTLPGRGPGDSVSFAFAAWSISSGAMTYQEALSAVTGGLGVSAIGNGYPLGGGGTPPALTFGNATPSQPWLINGFTIITRTVPEPSPLFLGIAGATSLWLFRRRK